MNSGRVLRKEVLIHAPFEQVWAAWTTEQGLAFLSKKSNVQLIQGGPYEWFLDLPADEQGNRGSQGAKVLAFRPEEMLAFDWTFPPDVPSLRLAGARTRVQLLFDQLDDAVRVRFAQSGWQEGEDWDQGWAYFDRAWDFVLNTMKEHLEPL
jgi:uncharacterized protein YndB with AHSA1/START domain